MPIHWKEVKATLEPARFNIRTGPEILKKSKPWADYEQAARSLSDAIEKVLSKKNGKRKT
jgi:bifunctional non-homologous end joining protein LigD